MCIPEKTEFFVDLPKKHNTVFDYYYKKGIGFWEAFLNNLQFKKFFRIVLSFRGYTTKDFFLFDIFRYRSEIDIYNFWAL